MGYTHYWTQRRNFAADEWSALCVAARAILKATPIGLAFEFTAPGVPPCVDHQMIRFNGIRHEGHETFLLLRQRPDRTSWQDEASHGFQFCKTAAKPYDAVVVAMLIAADQIAPGVLEISSDGEAEDWRVGLALAKRAVPAFGPATTAPLGVIRPESRA